MAAAQNPQLSQDAAETQDLKVKVKAAAPTVDRLADTDEEDAVPLGFSKSKYNLLMSSHRKVAQVCWLRKTIII